MKQLSLVVAVMLASMGFAAESTPATKLEIDHLFSYLKESGCQFFRNGTWYSAREAAGHLNRKYQDLQEKGLVPSAEAFIQKGGIRKQYEWASLSSQVRFEASRKPAPIGSARSWNDTVNGDIEACFGGHDSAGAPDTPAPVAVN